MNSLIFEQGDIVVAILPFSDQSGKKRRPALVISGNRHNKNSLDVILLQITSKQKSVKWRIPLSNSGLQEGRLVVESRIKIDSPVTFHKELVERKIGKITGQKLAEVKKSIEELYEL